MGKFKIVVGFQKEGMKSTIMTRCHTQDVALYHSKGNIMLYYMYFLLSKPPGNSHMKRSGVLIVSPRGINQGF